MNSLMRNRRSRRVALMGSAVIDEERGAAGIKRSESSSRISRMAESHFLTGNHISDQALAPAVGRVRPPIPEAWAAR